MKPALVLGLALAANAFSADQYDNELRIAPIDEFGGIKQYPRNIRFDEEGRELFTFKIPRYRNLTNRFPGILLDDEADDEFMLSPFRRRYDDPEIRKVNDKEVGDELFAAARGRPAAARKSHPGLAQFIKKHPGVALNNQDDDELSLMDLRLFVDRRAEALRRDDEDDELLLRLINNYFADDELIKPPKRPQVYNTNIQQKDDEFLVRPVVPFVVADDELHSGPKVGPRLFVERQRPRQAEVLGKDDEADNELGYLDELLREAPFDGAVFRVFDDELRAEKLGPLKGENLKGDDELFEVRGKVRPFLPFS